MNPKNIDFRKLPAYLIVAMAYPLIAYFSAWGDKLLRMIDAMTICAFVFIVIGAFNILVLHGDTDIITFVADRFFTKGKSKGWKAYKEDREESRKHSFNYPLFTGLVMLAAAIILTKIYY